jgi:hypothetical protein
VVNSLFWHNEFLQVDNMCSASSITGGSQFAIGEDENLTKWRGVLYYLLGRIYKCSECGSQKKKSEKYGLLAQDFFF